MKHQKYKLKGFLRIPYHENYLLHSNGKVYLCDQSSHNIDNWQMVEVKPLYSKESITIELDNEIFDYVKIYINTWYGINPFDYTLKYTNDFDISDRIKFIIPDEFIQLMNNYDDFIYRNHRFIKLKDHPDYVISEYGTIYSRFYNRPIKYWNSRSLHIKVSIQNKTYDIHRLVYQYFVGNIEDDLEIDHLYSTSRHHYLDLEMIDGFENKRRYREKNNEFSEEEIKGLCKLMEDNIHPDEIFSKMNLEGRINPLQLRNLTRNIKYGYSWTDISKDYDVINYNPVSHKPNKSKSGLTNEMVLEIYRLSHQMPAKEVAKKYNIGESLVYTIKNRKRYKNVLTDQNLQNMSSTTIESYIS
jgi:hypothetical protein